MEKPAAQNIQDAYLNSARLRTRNGRRSLAAWFYAVG